MNCELMLTYDTPAYMFNVYKNQQSRQKEVWIWRVQKCFPQYGIAMWSLWPNIRFLPSIVAQQNATKNILGPTKGRTEVKQYSPSGGAGVSKQKRTKQIQKSKNITSICMLLVLINNNINIYICVQWFEVRADCSFCWGWLNCW